MQSSFHPVHEYLEQCHAKWQRAGNPHGYATMWVERYLGAKESPATRLFEKTWGEAVDMYKKGEQWWYDDTLKHVREAQDARFAEDVWHDVVEEYLDDKKGVTIKMVLNEAIKMAIDQCGKLERNRVADILRYLKWQQSTHVTINGKRKRGWIPK